MKAKPQDSLQDMLFLSTLLLPLTYAGRVRDLFGPASAPKHDTIVQAGVVHPIDERT